ncbi:MAG: hypothetical protein EHM48_02945 [Planctomycetaceae bacterium]|nr:MAG: hypothetical protein EHM48_02945 [Planctomycetaceae bacterium]
MPDTIKASNGLILVRPTGGILATDCGRPVFNCSSPAIAGCGICSCCGASRYLVCISGATGDCTVINNNTSGWLLTARTSGGYSFQSSSVKITLELATYWDETFQQYGRMCRTWTLNVYRNSDGNWVECFNADGTDDWQSDSEFWALDGNCSITGTKSGITFTIKPAEAWWPPKVRLTISGSNMCALTCTTGGNFYYKVNSVNLNGVYELPLLNATSCVYWLSGAGSYSYSIYGTNDCSGIPLKTVSGKYMIKVDLFNFRIWVTQDTTDAASPGNDFAAFWNAGDWTCKTMNLSGLADYDTRCLAWGYWNTAYVRCTAGGTATLVAIP